MLNISVFSLPLFCLVRLEELALTSKRENGREKNLLFVNLITNCLDFQSSLPQTYASLAFFSFLASYFMCLCSPLSTPLPQTHCISSLFTPPPSFQLCAQKIFPKRTAYQFRILFSIYRKNKEQNVKQLKCGRFYILSSFFFLYLCVFQACHLYINIFSLLLRFRSVRGMFLYTVYFLKSFLRQRCR